MGIDREQLDRWKRLVGDDPSVPVRAHWTALHAAARSLLVLVEQQADDIARLEAELEVTTREAALGRVGGRRSPRPRVVARRSARVNGK